MWKLLVNVLAMGSLLWGMAGTASAGEAVPTTGNDAMEWQMLPGESLNSLAALFYPKDPRMQQRFVASAIAMNRGKLQSLTPAQTFEEPTVLHLPTLHALSSKAGKPARRAAASRKPASAAKAAAQESAKVSAPPSKEQAAAYQALEKRSEQRRQELDKLNQRLKSLEENTKAMQDSIKANSQPIEEEQGRRLKRVE